MRMVRVARGDARRNEMATRVLALGLCLAAAAGAATVIVGNQDFAYNIPFCGS